MKHNLYLQEIVASMLPISLTPRKRCKCNQWLIVVTILHKRTANCKEADRCMGASRHKDKGFKGWPAHTSLYLPAFHVHTCVQTNVECANLALTTTKSKSINQKHTTALPHCWRYVTVLLYKSRQTYLLSIKWSKCAH